MDKMQNHEVVDRMALEQESLRGYGLLFEGPGPFLDLEFSSIADRARRAVGTAQGCVSILNDEIHMRFNAEGGFAELSPRRHSVCHPAMQRLDDDGVFVVEDAGQDAQLADLPWVNGQVGAVRFYASAAIIGREGVPVGLVCCFSEEPRSLAPHERAAMRLLADNAIGILENRGSSALLPVQ